jgi:hypothetical protein
MSVLDNSRETLHIGSTLDGNEMPIITASSIVLMKHFGSKGKALTERCKAVMSGQLSSI